MMMGIGLALATLGAILRYAIESEGDEFDLPTVGLILMIVGSVAFVTGVGLEYMQRRAAAPRHPVPPAPLPPATVPAGAPPAPQPPAAQPPAQPH